MADLNGDNVELVRFGTSYGEQVRQGFCNAYHVDYPDFGSIIVKKQVPQSDRDLGRVLLVVVTGLGLLNDRRASRPSGSRCPG